MAKTDISVQIMHWNLPGLPCDNEKGNYHVSDDEGLSSSRLLVAELEDTCMGFSEKVGCSPVETSG